MFSPRSSLLTCHWIAGVLVLLTIQSTLVPRVEAFVGIAPYTKTKTMSHAHVPSSSLAPLQMMDASIVQDAVTSFSSSPMLLAETEEWVQPLASVLDPFLNLLSFAMLCRVVLSWYPTTNLNELPFSLVSWPTEPLLRAIRGAVPPAFGVDITPIVWLGVFTFFHEILLGQQGLLTMKIKYGM